MKLTPKPFERLQSAEPNLNQLESHFKTFAERLSLFEKSSCPVRGVKVKTQEDGKSFVVTYKTVRLRFRLVLQLSLQGQATARIVCTWADSTDKMEVPELGSFTVDKNNNTDLVDSTDGDQIDLEGMAPEIVLHFLLAALQQGEA